LKTSGFLIACFFLFSISLSNSTAQSHNEKKLIVKLNNIPDSTYLYIYQGDKILDSMIVLGGKGEYIIRQKKPLRIFLRNKDFKRYWYKSFWLEQSDIIVEGDYGNSKDTKVTGSKSNLLYDSFSAVDKEYRNYIDSLQKKKEAMPESSQKQVYLEKYGKLLKQNKYSYVSLEWLAWQCLYKSLTKKEISNYLNQLSKDLQKDSVGLIIKKYISLSDIPQIGEKFVDFQQLTPDNKIVKLSDYAGKITLVEFWGSGCYPCRVENPGVVKLYEKYHPQGFNFLGVSMDNDKNRWMKAIEEDKLPWTNVSDLKGSFNEAGLIYGITAIPSNFLINKDGIITHKDLRGDDLKKVLEDIFK
jgi:peroxiredoxin